MNKYLRTTLALLGFILGFHAGFSQDSLRVMTYNLLNYGNITSFCTTNNNNVNDKDDYLKTIVDYVKPDILGVCEMASNAIYGQRILDNVLNVDTITYYRKATYSNQSVSNLVNMLFYDSRKLGMREEIVAPTAVRDVNLYRLFYKDPDLALGADTIFLTVVVAHLKAGNTASDQLDRQAMAQATMGKLKVNSLYGNILLMGDLNVYTSSEAAYQVFINDINPLYRFYDPVNEQGAWNNNSNFSNVHTQSTHTSAGCHSSGGMDDRFDQILSSSFILNDSLGLGYKSGSYYALGQDGNRFNGSLLSPTNNSAPPAVIQALYDMSDHLPVILDLDVELAMINGLSGRALKPDCGLEITGNSINVSSDPGAEWRIFDGMGRQMATGNLWKGDHKIQELLKGARGLFLLQLANPETDCVISHKFMIR